MKGIQRLLTLCLSLIIFFGCVAGVSADTQGEADKKLLLEIKQLAEQGELKGCPFPLKTPIEAVQKEWGEGNAEPDYAIYDYPEKSTSFLVGDEKLKWIIRWAPLENEIPFSNIKEVLGEPKEGDAEFITYEFGEYTLMFTYQNFPDETKKQTSLHLFLT